MVTNLLPPGILEMVPQVQGVMGALEGIIQGEVIKEEVDFEVVMCQTIPHNSRGTDLVSVVFGVTVAGAIVSPSCLVLGNPAGIHGANTSNGLNTTGAPYRK